MIDVIEHPSGLGKIALALGVPPPKESMDYVLLAFEKFAKAEVLTQLRTRINSARRAVILKERGSYGKLPDTSTFRIHEAVRPCCRMVAAESGSFGAEQKSLVRYPAREIGNYGSDRSSKSSEENRGSSCGAEGLLRG